MQVIESYIIYLEKLVAKPLPKRRIKPYVHSIELAINGQLSKTLRKHVPMTDLQASGAFFTGESMADQVVASIPEAELTTLTALDSACGGGNLLLALARRLPLAATLAETVAQWGQQLHGMDIHQQFVRATRARLMLLTTLRGLAEVGPAFFECRIPTPALAFPKIVQADSLSPEVNWPPVKYYLLNPPYNRVFVPKWYRLATGRASQAALFIHKGLKQAQAGTIIRAILPDVLRSGSYYNKWRRHVALTAVAQPIQALGQFDEDTNVNVFLLSLEVREQVLEQPIEWVNCQPAPVGTSTIGQKYSVRVGRVVPHRDKEEGEIYPYLDVHSVPAWGNIIADLKARRYTGTTFKPPFVVVRRTSRANDPCRAVGTIVRASNAQVAKQVAVENHLLVVRPDSGLLSDCEALLAQLRDPRTSDWLNERIRCRHLTVGAVQSIPLWSNG
ncbi:MAG: hypothetical protein ACRYFV_05795 [Janthinobacterium lividum]